MLLNARREIRLRWTRFAEFGILTAPLYAGRVNRKRSNENLCWVPLAIAGAVALAALTATLLSALFTAHPGLPAHDPPLGNALAVARTYAFRLALRNSALVTITAGLAVFALARISQPHIGEMRRTRLWLLALALTPLFLPIPYAAYVWRALFDTIDKVNRPIAALLALALVQVWRLWPLALLTHPLVRVSSPARAAAATALIALWLAVVDIGTPLLATGGEPFNATHLWATWTFQTLWVSRLWGHGAVMAGGLAALSGGLAALAAWILKPVGKVEPHRTSSLRSTTTILSAAALAATAPIIGMAPDAWATLQAGGLEDLMRVGYWSWGLLSFMALAAAALVAGCIVWPVRSRCGLHRVWVQTGCLILGAATAPIWYGLAWRWSAWPSGVAGLLLAATVSGVSAGLIGAWWAARYAANARTRTLAAAAVTLAALANGVQFALWIIANVESVRLTLGTGPVMRLGYDAAFPLVGLAAVLTFVLTFGAIAAVAYSSWPDKALR